MTGPSTSPMVTAASKNPIYLIFWSASRITSKLRPVTDAKLLMNPIDALKAKAVITIAMLLSINVTSPKLPKKALEKISPK